MFVGIGTGRCGSTSLSKILDSCFDVTCTHEAFKYRTGWNDEERIGAHLLLQEANGIFGDIAAYWLPHIEWLRQHIEVKVIVLQRPKEEFIKSIHKVWNGQNYFVEMHRFGRSWDCVIRKTPGKNLRESANKYWEYYYETAAKIEDTLWLQMMDLNDDNKLDQLYDYLGVIDRQYPKQRKWNQRP